MKTLQLLIYNLYVLNILTFVDCISTFIHF